MRIADLATHFVHRFTHTRRRMCDRIAPQVNHRPAGPQSPSFAHRQAPHLVPPRIIHRLTHTRGSPDCNGVWYYEGLPPRQENGSDTHEPNAHARRPRQHRSPSGERWHHEPRGCILCNIERPTSPSPPTMHFSSHRILQSISGGEDRSFTGYIQQGPLSSSSVSKCRCSDEAYQ